MTKQPAHAITLEPWKDLGFYTRTVIEMTNTAMWPLEPDDRITVMITLLAKEIAAIEGDDDQIEAILDILRLKLKWNLRPQ